MQIRLATLADCDRILAIYAPFCQNTPVSFEYQAPSLEDIQGRVEKVLCTLPWLVAEDENGIAGYAYASQHKERAAYQWCCEVSVYLGENYRGVGLGQELYEKLFELLRKMGYCNVYAGITLPNPASKSLHEKMGFKLVGVYEKVGYKFSKWHDVGWWHLRLMEPNTTPSKPLLISELKERDLILRT